MSLLNDALRAAEQRQGRPDVSTAYTGQVNRQPAAHRWLVPVMALLLVILVVVAVYGYFFRAPVTQSQVTERTENAQNETADEPMPAETPVVSKQVSDPAPKAEPESELAQTPEPKRCWQRIQMIAQYLTRRRRQKPPAQSPKLSPQSHKPSLRLPTLRRY
ncbi:hypothetical protein [Marinobacter similis]|uniref:Uncharacterized protein n=1 Tax=Marinobacter similis TaxID=1420916 RepID=W5YLR2_9GAMM|nr:hypothetical protein [Marinobacter similis]AHI30157.1 hypothetical protein AU14_13555 [Marinobacter similis]